MIHLVSHFLGIDTQSSPFYDFWSGLGPCVVAVVVAVLVYRVERAMTLRSLEFERRSLELEERLFEMEKQLLEKEDPDAASGQTPGHRT